MLELIAFVVSLAYVWLLIRERRAGWLLCIASGLLYIIIYAQAKLYSDALQNRRNDIIGLISIYALTNRIRLTSSPQVVEAADTVCRIIIDAYLAPNITLEEMRANWIDRHVDPLRDFSEACRKELLQIF